MPKKRVKMRKLREVFRLKFEERRKHREIATACKISPGTVSDMVCRFGEAGLEWPTKLSDEELENALYSSSASTVKETESRPVPDWNEVHRELQNPKVHLTLHQLWKEYKQQNPENHYSYSSFCEQYKSWANKLEPVMRQTHKFGEKCFVDFAGDRLPIIDPDTGEVREAEIFVATLGASNYLYCDVCWSQDLPNWLRMHVNLMDYLKGCPAVLVPDNLKAGVTKACYYEPSVNISYEELGKHYGVAIIPTRVAKPKDKAKVEGGVLIVEREILAPLRKRTFVGLCEAREALWEKLEEVNSRPFQKLEGSRRELFEKYEKPELRPLPKYRFDEGIWLQAKVHIDYHIQVKGHYYSVPYSYIGRRLEVRLTSSTVTAFWQSERIASHKRNFKKSGHTTLDEHMPEHHRRQKDWTPAKVASWAESIGPETHALVSGILARRRHPEQGVRACLGVMSLRRKFNAERLERACRRAVLAGAFSYQSVDSILKKNLDSQPLPEAKPQRPIGHHENVRGSAYYGSGKGASHAVATHS